MRASYILDKKDKFVCFILPVLMQISYKPLSARSAQSWEIFWPTVSGSDFQDILTACPAACKTLPPPPFKSAVPFFIKRQSEFGSLEWKTVERFKCKDR